MTRPPPKTIPAPRPIVLVTGGRDYADRANVSRVLMETGPGLVWRFNHKPNRGLPVAGARDCPGHERNDSIASKGST